MMMMSDEDDDDDDDDDNLLTSHLDDTMYPALALQLAPFGAQGFHPFP